MAGPRFLTENFFDVQQYPNHTLTAEEETTGNEAWRVGTGRRVGGGVLRNYWTPTTANSLTWIECQCDRARAADTLIIDRGHNLDAETVFFQISDDSHTTATSVFGNTVVPSNVYANSRMSDLPGVKTTEGAWVIKFDYHVARCWRLYVVAMGADLKPKIPGVYLGLSFAPTNPPPRPWDDEPLRLAYDTIESEALWVSSSRKAKRREATVRMRMNSQLEVDQARLHFRSRYQRGGLVWYVPDTDNAERAWLANSPPTTDVFAYPTDYRYPTLEVPMVEHAPKSD